MAYLPDRPESHTVLRILLPLVLLVTVGGCSMAPDLAAPPSLESLPTTFDAPMPENVVHEEAAVAGWWSDWDDEGLNTVLAIAHAANLDLRIAAARVMEVQQSHRATRALMFPGVQAGVDGSRQNTPTNLGATGQFSASIPNFPDRFDVTQYSASASMAWEIDFWGKARASSRAAMGQLLATRADYQAAYIGVMSESIATYFEIRDLSAQMQLADVQLDLLTERLELTEDRYRKGLVTSFEWYNIQQTVDEARAARPLLDAQWVAARGRMAVLLGSTIELVDTVMGEYEAPFSNSITLPNDLPSDLVRARPDVQAAAARLEAARQQVGVRRAEQFPSFSLTASGGTQSSDLSKLVETSQRFWLFGGSLTAPVFAAGARRAAVKIAWAQYEQAAASYEKVVLMAFQEVSASLAGYEAERRRFEAVQSSHETALSSLETVKDRYRRGVGDYVAYLDAQLSELRTRTTRSSATRTNALSRLNLYRSLGGAWPKATPGATDHSTASSE